MLIDHLSQKIGPIKKLIKTIAKNNGTVFLVGGAVRDLVMNKLIGDVDLEVHGIEQETIESILKKFGPVSFVGKKFGVFKLHQQKVDLSLPRIDSEGRKPTVALDPHMGIKRALIRRDVTMNAMAINLNLFVEEGNIQIVDPFDGQNDIAQKTIRAVDTTLFIQDPLRFFRVMHFIGRFEMLPDQNLDALCAQMSLSPDEIAGERIFMELKKLFCKSKKPSMGFVWVKSIGRLDELFPELAQLSDENFDQAMQALDRAAIIKTERSHAKIILCMTALCHKLNTEEQKKLVKRITSTLKLQNISQLFLKHLPAFLALKQNSDYDFKLLAYRLAPHASIETLARAVGIIDPNYEKQVDMVTQQAKKLTVFQQPIQAIVTGKDLFRRVKNGKQIGLLLEKSYLLQLAGTTHKKELLNAIFTKD